MFWIKFFNWKKIVFFFLSAISLLGCKIEPTIAPVLANLNRGVNLGDAVLVSNAPQFNLIEVSSIYNDELIKNKNIPRPTIISNYNLKDYVKVLQVVNEKTSFNLSFSWKVTNHKYVMAAIFKDIIQIKENKISNKEAIVWSWNSTEKDIGQVKYSDGKITTLDKDGLFAYSDVKEGLKAGNYVWAVWAWDNNGINIIASSREFPFIVK
ncbi:MAG: hypothetical protein ACOVO2_05390 [Emticicia sp.]|uniref:hypothetical protein n=1 Tax=Emticicia sp. TaxID=1930953 RepID=UPI003BA70101